MTALSRWLVGRLPEDQLRFLVRLRHGDVAPLVRARAVLRGGRDGRPRVIDSFDAEQATRDTAELIRQALERHQVAFIKVPGPRGTTRLIAISQQDRAAAVAALTSELSGPEWMFLRHIDAVGRPLAHLAPAPRRGRPTPGAASNRLRLYRLLAAGSGEVLGGREQHCMIEFWTPVEHDGTVRPDGGTYPVGTRLAPRGTEVVAYLSADNWRRATASPDHWLAEQRFPTIFRVHEPVDLVYTWVDGDDPAWQHRKNALSGQLAEHNVSAAHASRYVSRDELRYSLRSVAMYASWVRRIYIVTDQQCPPWLDTSHPKIELVDHKQIFADADALPVFNSHAIESQLHHIPGLAEHYLYLNDDFFFGRPVAPELFFEGNGIARFFPSRNTLDIDPPSREDKPVLTAAKRNRRVIEDVFGLAIVNKFKHTPQPQLRSVLEEMERRHPDMFRTVSHSRFRHPDDVSIPSALHHYYAYALGRAIPGEIAYHYQEIDLPNTARRLDNFARDRNVDVFCLNDSENSTASFEEQSRMLRSFFERYYPLPSPFER